MEQMNLKKIAEACGGKLVLGTALSQKSAEAVGGRITEETEITGAVLDSRQVTEGMLFFATVGERVDGHKFIGGVFEKGACAVVCQKTPEQVEAEHGLDAASWGAYILVEDTLQALKDVAEYYRSTLQIPIVGITGSVGKTSTKEYIAGVLSEKYNVLKTEGNFNNEIGVPLTLLRIRKEHEAAVVEMGISEFGEMRRLSKMVRPNVCVITNIGQCHLENLKTRDGILQAKTEMFEYMAEDAQVCLNGDDDKLAGVKTVGGKAVHYFGLGANCEEEVYAAEIVSKGLFGSDAKLHLRTPIEESEQWEEQILDIEVTQPGVHMVTNAAAAACVGRILGLTGDEMAEGIRKVAPVRGRSRLVAMPHYTLIDDCYNANPVSMKAAIDLLNMAENKKIAVLGDMFELGADSDALHEQVGAYAAASGIDCLICAGANSVHMERGAKAQGDCEVRYFAQKADLVAALKENRESLIPNDSTVLLKASNGMQFVELLELLQK